LTTVYSPDWRVAAPCSSSWCLPGLGRADAHDRQAAYLWDLCSGIHLWILLV